MSKNKHENEEVISMTSENTQQEIITQTEPEFLPETLIYCGPDLPKYGLKAYRLYQGGLPLNVQDAAKAIPEILKLIIPYKELEAMRAKCKQKGTPEFEYYARIESTKIL